LVRSLAPKRVNLGLPRFRIETGTSLKTLLAALGMQAAFDPNRLGRAKDWGSLRTALLADVRSRTGRLGW
jgi:hypothetical protein